MSFSSDRINCIALDLDGTLIRSGYFSPIDISKENISAIRKYCDTGNNQIVLSTGRDVNFTLEVFEYLVKQGFSNKEIPYLICLNGATIIDTQDPKHPISNFFFEENLCKDVVRYLRKKKLNYFLINEHKEVCHPLNLLALIIYKFFFKKKHKTRICGANFRLDNIHKLIVVLKFPRIPIIKRSIKKKIGEGLYIAKCNRFCFSIIDNKINKFFGIQEIAKRMGLSTNNFAAIGDEQNDIMSLENVGFGIGMNLKKHIEFDNSKIQLKINNNQGTGVAEAVYEMKKRGLW